MKEQVGFKIVLGVDTGPAQDEIDRFKKRNQGGEGSGGPSPGVSGRSYEANLTELAEAAETQMRARGQRPNYIQRGAP